MYLNLDPDFKPFGEGVDFDSFFFSGGEAHVKLKIAPMQYDHYCKITTRLHSGDDIMTLLMATDALRRFGVRVIDLFVPYLPYARQDRVMVKGEPLSLKVFADLINAQHYERVYSFDVHSDVTDAVFNNFIHHDNHKFVKRILETKKDYLLVSPDAGALKKIYKLVESLNYKDEVVIGIKNRNITDGRITNIDIASNGTIIKDRDCYIPDDILDGGRTFIELSQKLKGLGAKSVNLIISHGIFSKGLKPLFDIHNGIDRIYTTNSFRDYDSMTEFGAHNEKYLDRLTVSHIGDVL